MTEAAFVSQLQGEHCRFMYNVDRCEQRGFDPFLSLFTENHDCDMWAVSCLRELKTPAAVAGMISVLSTITDVQTCDGVRPIRSYAVAYLGESGAQEALAPLKRLLASSPKQKLSAGASGCTPGPENVDVIRDAIANLEQSQR